MKVFHKNKDKCPKIKGMFRNKKSKRQKKRKSENLSKKDVCSIFFLCYVGMALGFTLIIMLFDRIFNY